jgi:hypothetical protein
LEYNYKDIKGELSHEINVMSAIFQGNDLVVKESYEIILP